MSEYAIVAPTGIEFHDLFEDAFVLRNFCEVFHKYFAGFMEAGDIFHEILQKFL